MTCTLTFTDTTTIMEDMAGIPIIMGTVMGMVLVMAQAMGTTRAMGTTQVMGMAVSALGYSPHLDVKL